MKFFADKQNWDVVKPRLWRGFTEGVRFFYPEKRIKSQQDFIAQDTEQKIRVINECYFLIVCPFVYGISAIYLASLTALETIRWCFWHKPVRAEEETLNWPDTNLRRTSVFL